MKFDIKPFVKTLLIFLLLSAAWTYFSMNVDWFTHGMQQLVPGFGYIIILMTSIYLGRKREFFGKWVMLILSAIVIFSVSLLLYGLSDIHVMVYFTANSIFLAWAFTVLLNRFYGISRKWQIMTATAACVLCGFVVVYYIFGTRDKHLLYTVMQLSLILPLAAGLSIRLKEAPAGA